MGQPGNVGCRLDQEFEYKWVTCMVGVIRGRIVLLVRTIATSTMFPVILIRWRVLIPRGWCRRRRQMVVGWWNWWWRAHGQEERFDSIIPS
jgi:hypothetical protein